MSFPWRQGARDAQRAVAGEGPDLDGGFHAGSRDQDAQECALVVADLAFGYFLAQRGGLRAKFLQ
jgi:hypothetical protein